MKRDRWTKPYKIGVAWIPDNIVTLKNQLKIWKLAKWDNRRGKMMLYGDAALVMTV